MEDGWIGRGGRKDLLLHILTLFHVNSFFFVVVCFLLGVSPASDLYMPTFRNTLSVPSSKAGVKFFFFAGLCEVGCLPVITKQQLIRDSCLCQFCLRKFF